MIIILFWTIPDIAINMIPLRSFSKTFTEIPYEIGESIVNVSEETDTFVKEVFKMLDNYDKESVIFLDSLIHKAQKAVFATINVYDTTVNVLIRNLFSQIYSQIMKLGYSTYDDAKCEVDGFITKSKESYYVANQCNISFNFFERSVTIWIFYGIW